MKTRLKEVELDSPTRGKSPSEFDPPAFLLIPPVFFVPLEIVKAISGTQSWKSFRFHRENKEGGESKKGGSICTFKEEVQKRLILDIFDVKYQVLIEGGSYA